MRRMLACLVVAGAVMAVATPAFAQQATVTGKVTDQARGLALAGARVQASGTNYYAISNQEGVYTIKGVSPGAYAFRVIMLGYASQTKTVTVAAGGTTTLDWSLNAVPYTLEEVVTTATGEQLKRELGNTVGTIDAPQLVATAETPNLTAVLNGRVAGVTVIQNDGMAGSGSRIRIRGISSVSMSNDPLLYVDGIRVEQRGVGLSVSNGGNSPSFLNDINPEDIANIEIVKGPSAATLYGTQAANGVIRITTKRGRAGAPKWTLTTEQGMVHDPNKYLSVWYSQDAAGTGQCFPFQQALGQCTIGNLYSKNIMRDSYTSPLKDAYRSQYSAQVAGGSEAVRYFVAAEFENQDGTLKMPQSEIDFLKTIRGADAVIPKDQLDPNTLRKISVRTNLSANLGSKADVALNLGYINNNNRIAQSGDNLEGVFGAATYGTADPTAASPYGFARPAWGFADTEYRLSNHFINSGTANYRPFTWLSSRATVGLDYIAYEDQQLARNGESCPFCGNPEGIRALNRFQSYKYSVDLGATATFKLTSRIGSKTSLGAQYNKDNLTTSLNTGTVLPPGAQTFTGAANKSSSESTTKFVTLGSYIEQQFSLDDRLFVTGAVRIDQNSAFGVGSRSATYPKVSASWVAVDNHGGLLNSLRFRAAYGASGQQPGPLDAVQFYSGTTNAVFGGLGPGVSLGNLATFASGLGNTTLKPERSNEFEGGFDLGLFDSHWTLEATVYQKKTSDALVQRLLPGSLGAVQSRTDNVGDVKNEGIELSLLGRLIDSPKLQWDIQVEVSGNRNRLVALAEGVPPPTGFGFQQAVGFPLYGIWWPKITSYADANGDGFIDPSEVSVTDTAVFNGGTIPSRTISLGSNIALFGGKLRIGGQLDYKGGYVSHDVSTMFQCLFVGDCQYLNDPNTSLYDQARAVSGVFGDWAEPGDYLRLREANVSWTLPRGVSRAFRASNAMVTVTGRNLWLHFLKGFGGWDSEINTVAGVAGDGPAYNFVQPGQSRYVSVRLQLTF